MRRANGTLALRCCALVLSISLARSAHAEPPKITVTSPGGMPDPAPHVLTHIHSRPMIIVGGVLLGLGIGQLIPAAVLLSKPVPEHSLFDAEAAVGLSLLVTGSFHVLPGALLVTLGALQDPEPSSTISFSVEVQPAPSGAAIVVHF